MFLKPEATKRRQGKQDEMRVDSETWGLFHLKKSRKTDQVHMNLQTWLVFSFYSYSHLPINSGDCLDKNHMLIAYVWSL